MNSMIRIDSLIVKKGLLDSRTKAAEAIKKGLVLVNGTPVKKASELFYEDVVINLTDSPYKFVSRAGDKLEKVLIEYKIDVKDKVCLDIGASTGGFTHCLLTYGASKVYAVDVGSEQLDNSLKNDNRVISIENTDIRRFESDILFDIITVDVSFISITYIFNDIKRLLDDKGTAIILIKPQFECGRQSLNKNGVVTSKNVHIKLLSELIQYINNNQMYVTYLDFSPIKGKNGNIEFLMCIKKGAKSCSFDIKKIVFSAHER